ncbi:DUF3558 family protein [Amycolatopsis sp. lyj-112]|uniref:DUF3558 family protein n=1 Tax=Amycolatopsis sp. lyj-112 TaxID=2789288 RepID=UPI00397940FF
MKRLLAIVILLFISACGATPSQDVIDVGLGRKAPLVPKPLDAAGLLADPCAVFPNNPTLVRIEETDRGKTPGCKMTTGEGKPLTIDILLFPEITKGLEQLYEYHRNDAWKNGYFEPVTVSGYPAVFAAIRDDRPIGKCDLNVALTDQLFFAVFSHAHQGGTGCEFARAIASSVIETLNHTQ